MNPIPCPSADAVPFNEPEVARLDPGEKAVFTFQPTQQRATFFLVALGISKEPEMTYEAKADGNKFFGPSGAPPTDPDDLSTTFIPAREFSNELKVIARNVSDSTTRRIICQPVGFEEVP